MIKNNSTVLNRGMRNYNPANIRHSASRWRGMYHNQYDSDFVVYVNMTYGIRALICLLRTYYTKYHLTSVYEIISRYAPPSENNTDEYIDYVASHVKIDKHADLQLSFSKKYPCETLHLLCDAICTVESGYPVSYVEFRNALRLI